MTRPGAESDDGPAAFPRGQRTVLVAAGVAVLIYGLHLAAPLFVPFMVSLFLAAVCFPLVHVLVGKGVPIGLAVLGAILGMVLLVLLLGAIVGLSFGDLPEVRKQAEENVSSFFENVEDTHPGVARVLDRILPEDGKTILQQAAGFLQGLALKLLFALKDLIAQTFLILMTMAFMLLEAAGMPRKIVVAFGSQGTLDRFSAVLKQVQSYLAIKTGVSLITGLAAGTLLWVLDVPFAVVWGFLAFALNFIPNIGSILAAIPPALLALVVCGPMVFGFVVLGFSVINIGLGSILEPMLLGRRMGLSTLVIFLSMVIWSQIWGPVGMILSVPLTMTMKIFLDHSEEFRWVAVLLSASPQSAKDEKNEPQDT